MPLSLLNLFGMQHDMLGKRLYFRSLVPPQQAYRANHIVHFIFTKSVESMMVREAPFDRRRT